MEGRLLVVDDDETTCEYLATTLRAREFDTQWATSGEDALTALERDQFDAVLTDLEMAGMDGLEMCHRALESHPNLPIIVVTGHANLEAAVSAMRAGAYDFLTKPVDQELLAHQARRAVERGRLAREVRELRSALHTVRGLGKMVGSSRPMRRVYDLVDRVARSEATVLVVGESGTGKELVASAIHSNSDRSDGPFVAVNCSAIPDTLIESELFGHAKGAFTDARQSRPGLFVRADKGTLFLDEVGELPLTVQPKLLRALQERVVRPVGSTEEVPFDVRIVAATNRDLEADVADDHFREDLLYRIDVVRVELPPLRARGHDVLELAQHFLDQHPGEAPRELDADVARRLLDYPWPGNVRELQNCIERAVALARHRNVTVEDLPAKVLDFRPERIDLDEDQPEELLKLDEVEARYINQVLSAVDGNKSRAARILGLDRRSLYRRLEKYHL